MHFGGSDHSWPKVVPDRQVEGQLSVSNGRLLVQDSDSLTTHTKYMRINTNAAVGQQTNNVSTVYDCLFSHGIQAACYIFRCTWKHDGKLPPLLMPSWFHEMLECQAPVALCPSRSFTKVFFIDHSRWPCLHYLLHSCNDDDENVAIPAVHLLELSALQKPVFTCLSPLLHTLFARGRPRRTFRWSFRSPHDSADIMSECDAGTHTHSRLRCLHRWLLITRCLPYRIQATSSTAVWAFASPASS